MKKIKKNVLLTGGSRGIGVAIYKSLTSEGYTVIAPPREHLNLGDPYSLKTFIDNNKDLQIDIIINNAGINIPQWIEELDDKNLENTMQVNLLSPIKLIRGFIQHMIQHKWGRIVNISSIFGIIARGKQVPYVASKHGLNGVTKVLALELAKYNILVNSVCPGFVATELVLQNSSSKIDNLIKDIPLKRLAKPQEIAELVLFLISEKNTYITGAEILIDGGFTCK